MNVKRFKQIINERIRITKETNDDWSDGIEMCENEIINIFRDDIVGSLEYLYNDCTETEFIYISEFLYEIINKTQNNEFLYCFEYLMKKYPAVSMKYNMQRDLDYAKSYLKE